MRTCMGAWRMISCNRRQSSLLWRTLKLCGPRTSRTWIACCAIAILLNLTTPCGAVNLYDPVVPDRPIDGYLNSGRFYPKLLYWRGIRKPPGIQWFAFFSFAGASYWALLVAISACASSELKQFAWLVQGTELTSTLVFSTITISALSDEVTAYLIGVCAAQVYLDMGRQQQSDGLISAVLVFFTLFAFLFGSVVGVSLLDSYHKMNLLNCVYTNTYGLVICPILAIVVYNHRKPCARFVGVLVSTGHLGFCIWAFLIARNVEAVHMGVLLAFLCTAGATSVLISLFQLCIRSPRAADRRDV